LQIIGFKYILVSTLANRGIMQSQVQKWGNSLGIRIPQALAKKLYLNSGSRIELDVVNQSLVIKKSNLELDTLLDRINSSNCHHDNFADDSSVGNESW
jgi:antitoxin MazE